MTVSGAAGGLTWTLSSGGGAIPAAASGAAAVRPTATLNAQVTLDLNVTKAALIASGYGVDAQASPAKNCAIDSYGAIHSFFVAHSCVWLARISLAVKKGSNPLILVAISWVDMPSTSLAIRYRRLVDMPDTGNVTELSRQIGPYKQVRYSGLLYESGRYGTEVWNAEVQPTGAVSPTAVRTILRAARQRGSLAS